MQDRRKEEEESLTSTWMTAEESLEVRMKEKKKENLPDFGDLPRFLQPDNDSSKLEDNSD